MRFNQPIERCALRQGDMFRATLCVTYEIIPRLTPEKYVYFAVEENRYNFTLNEGYHTTIEVEPTYDQASKVLQKKVAGLVKQGYEIDFERSFADIHSIKRAQKVLLPDVLKLLREKYPVGAVLESPTGRHGVITHLNYDGSIQVRLEDGAVMVIPFGQYQQMKVV